MVTRTMLAILYNIYFKFIGTFPMDILQFLDVIYIYIYSFIEKTDPRQNAGVVQ